jgi:hypothetical protein
MNTLNPGGGVDAVAETVAEPVTDYGSDPVSEPASVTTVSAGITPEIVAVIQAAANEFVGSQVRILSVRVLSGMEPDSSSWAGRGRDIIHASHNLVQRGH